MTKGTRRSFVSPVSSSSPRARAPQRAKLTLPRVPSGSRPLPRPTQKLGNEAFSAGKYADAVEHFTAAIAIDAGNHVFYSNRSAAYAGLQNFDAALADAEKTTEIKPDWSKGYSRKGAALYGLRRFDDAIAAYEAGLAIDPESEVLKSGLADVKSAAARANSGAGAADPMGSIGAMLSSPELYGKLATDPSTRGFLSQPASARAHRRAEEPGQARAVHERPSHDEGALRGARRERDERRGGGQGGAQRRREDTAAVSSAPEPVKVASARRGARAGRRPSPSPPVPRRRLRRRRSSATPRTRRRARRARSRTTTRRPVSLDARTSAPAPGREAPQRNLEKGGAFDAGPHRRRDAPSSAAASSAWTTRWWPRALTRKATPWRSGRAVEAAIEVYNKSLMEHRNADTLKRKGRCCAHAQARANAARYRARARQGGGGEGEGQRAFQSSAEVPSRGTWSSTPRRSRVTSADHRRAYSATAARAPPRSYTKLAAFNEALQDADKCIEIAPDFAKGYTRKGHGEFFTKQYDKALETYQARSSAGSGERGAQRRASRGTMIEIQRGQTGQWTRRR